VGKGLQAAKESFYLEGFYRGISPTSVDRVKKVLKLAAGLRCDRFLDVGCGDGTITMTLAEAMGAVEIHGIEISSQGASLARPKGINVVVCDVEEGEWPFPDGYFDAVYCGELLEHVFEPAHVLAEIHRVLRVGGGCLLTTPNLASWYNRLVLLLGFQPFEYCASLRYGEAGKFPFGGFVRGLGGEHVRVMTLGALKDLARRTNLKLRKVVGAHGVVPSRRPFWLLVVALDSLMSRWPPLATSLVVKMTK
jgi:methionine biosynthesis protein MetW